MVNGQARRKHLPGKSELVQMFPSAPNGVAIFDDPGSQMEEKTMVNFSHGLSPRSRPVGRPDRRDWAWMVFRFRMHYGKETLHMRVPMIGRHSIHTALRAASVGLNDGLKWQEIITGLSHDVNPTTPRNRTYRERRSLTIPTTPHQNPRWRH